MDTHVLENCCSLLVSLRKREKNWRLPYVVSNITTARRMCYLTKRTCFTSSERRTVTGMISPVDYHTLSVTNGHLFVAPATYKQSHYKRHLLLSGYLRFGPSDSLTLKSYHKQTLNHRSREIQTPDTSPKRTFFFQLCPEIHAMEKMAVLAKRRQRVSKNSNEISRGVPW